MPNQSTVALLGANSALGAAIARRLAAQGVSLVLLARDESKLNQMADDLRTRGAKVTMHVADFDELDRHDEIVKKIESADTVYTLYGTLPDQMLCEQNWDETMRALHTNFISAASLLSRLANVFEQRGHGNLVVVSSVAGDRGRKSNYIYGTAKGALSIFCAGLRNRLAGSGAHVLTVKPGFIDTPMTAHIEKKPAVLWVDADRVAGDIVKACASGKNELYTPWFWRFILLIIRLVPEPIFKRLSL